MDARHLKIEVTHFPVRDIYRKKKILLEQVLMKQLVHEFVNKNVSVTESVIISRSNIYIHLNIAGPLEQAILN